MLVLLAMRRQRGPQVAQPRPGAGRGPGLTRRWGGWGCAEARAPRPPFWRPAGWVGAAVRRRARSGLPGKSGRCCLCGRPVTGSAGGPRGLCGRRPGVCGQVAPSSGRGRPGTPRLPLHENRFFFNFSALFLARSRSPSLPELPRERFGLDPASRSPGRLGGRQGPGPQTGSGGERRVSPPRSPSFSKR